MNTTLQRDERQVVNRDEFYGDVEKSGQIALEKGLHPITLRYFDGGGGKSLQLLYDGPSFTKTIRPRGGI